MNLFNLPFSSSLSNSIMFCNCYCCDRDRGQRGAVRNLEALCSMIVNKEEDYSKEQFNRIATDIVNVMTSFRSSDDLNAQPGEITVPHLLMTSLAALEQGIESSCILRWSFYARLFFFLFFSCLLVVVNT